MFFLEIKKILPNLQNVFFLNVGISNFDEVL